MWCIASLFWHDRFQWSESAFVLVLTCSFTRCSKYNTACFDCLRTVHAYFSSVLPFTTINKWFNAEVTWIPKESSLLQSHTFVVFFFVRFGVVWFFFLRCYCSRCDMRLQFWLFFLRCMHYLHISLLFHVLENWTRATNPTCALFAAAATTQTQSIDKY